MGVMTQTISCKKFGLSLPSARKTKFKDLKPAQNSISAIIQRLNFSFYSCSVTFFETFLNQLFHPHQRYTGNLYNSEYPFLKFKPIRMQ